MDLLYGLHPVEEAVATGGSLITQVLLARERRDSRLEALERQCRAAGVRVSSRPRAELTRLAQTEQHQGVLAMLRERPVLALEDLFAGGARDREKGETKPRLLLALDGVEDPHNLGALLRCCDGAGVDGVILTERRSAPLSAIVAKTSAGAVEHVRIARVTNLVRALEQTKANGFWVVGLDERGEQTYSDFDWRSQDLVLVLGREGAGLHDLVKRTCDHLLCIPMAGKVASLNVSVAGAVVLFEAVRQRRLPTDATSVVKRPTTAKRPTTSRGLGS